MTFTTISPKGGKSPNDGVMKYETSPRSSATFTMVHAIEASPVFASTSSAVELKGFSTRYVSVFVDGTGMSITALCMQSGGNSCCWPFTIQMHWIPTELSMHESRKQ